MMEIVIGLFLLALGIWGLFDEYYYVADVFRGGLPIFLMFIGLLTTLAETASRKNEARDQGGENG